MAPTRQERLAFAPSAPEITNNSHLTGMGGYYWSGTGQYGRVLDAQISDQGGSLFLFLFVVVVICMFTGGLGVRP